VNYDKKKFEKFKSTVFLLRSIPLPLERLQTQKIPYYRDPLGVSDWLLLVCEKQKPDLCGMEFLGSSLCSTCSVQDKRDF